MKKPSFEESLNDPQVFSLKPPFPASSLNRGYDADLKMTSYERDNQLEENEFVHKTFFPSHRKYFTKRSPKTTPFKGKLKIDTLKDMNKLTFTQIKSLKICNLEGNLFEKMLNDIENVKRIDQFLQYKISSIEFQIHYETEFGNTVCVLGSCKGLGNWIPYSACAMHWSEGNLWKAWLPISELSNTFEYKYVMKNSMDMWRWEEGENREIKVSEIEAYLSKPENAYSVQSSTRYKFKLENVKGVYIREKMHLMIIDQWKS